MPAQRQAEPNFKPAWNFEQARGFTASGYIARLVERTLGQAYERQWKSWRVVERQPRWEKWQPAQRAFRAMAIRPTGTQPTENGKPASSARTQRNGHASNGKVVAKSGVAARPGNARKDARVDARSRKPALTAGAKAGNSKRYGFTAPVKQRTKKRG
jgi:hypothetical protein